MCIRDRFRLYPTNSTRQHSLATHGRCGERIAGKAGGGPHLDVVAKGLTRMSKSGRHNANDRVEIAIRINLSTKNIAIGGKRPPPQSVADYYSLGKSGCLILWS